MLPSGKGLGDRAQVSQSPSIHLPEMINSGEGGDVMADDHDDPIPAGADPGDYPVAGSIIQARKRLIKDHQIICPGKEAGEVESLQFTPGEGQQVIIRPSCKTRLPEDGIRLLSPASHLLPGGGGDMVLRELHGEDR